MNQVSQPRVLEQSLSHSPLPKLPDFSREPLFPLRQGGWSLTTIFTAAYGVRNDQTEGPNYLFSWSKVKMIDVAAVSGAPSGLPFKLYLSPASLYSFLYFLFSKTDVVSEFSHFVTILIRMVLFCSYTFSCGYSSVKVCGLSPFLLWFRKGERDWRRFSPISFCLQYTGKMNFGNKSSLSWAGVKTRGRVLYERNRVFANARARESFSERVTERKERKGC